MAQSEYGPSWQDCATAASYLWDRYGVRVDLRLCQSVRRMDGKGNSAWVVVASAQPREGRPGPAQNVQETWGQGGASKTAPQAIHRALLQLTERYDKWEKTAAKQAAF